MGRFLGMVVTLSALTLAACGDNSVNEPDQKGQGTGTDPSSAPSVPRYIPEVCGVQSWSTSIAGNPATHVSVVGRPGGAALLAVPSGGGALTGFAVDQRMILMGAPDGTKVALDQTFTSVSASQFNNRLVATGVQNGAVFIDLLDDNLTNPQWIAKLAGSHVAEPAFFSADGVSFMPIADDSGLTLVKFDDAFEPMDIKQIIASKPSTGLTAVQMGSATLAAWSTPSDCHLALITTFNGGTSATASAPCDAPHLAADPAHDSAVLVFEGPDGIRLMHATHGQMGGDSILLRPAASSPRAMFDGQRYWISYLDARGDLVVGFLDGNNHLVSMSLDGPQPQRDAYDLAVVDGAPWVFSLDVTGYNAHRLCITSAPSW